MVISRHRHDQPNPRIRALDFLEFVQERGRLTIPVGIDQRNPVREPFVLDVAKHRPEGGDADPAGDEDELARRVVRKHELPSRGLDLYLHADRKLGERAFEGAVADAGAQTDDTALSRRGYGGDVAPGAFPVLVRRVEKLDPEVLPRSIVEPFTEQVEDDEQ